MSSPIAMFFYVFGVNLPRRPYRAVPGGAGKGMGSRTSSRGPCANVSAVARKTVLSVGEMADQREERAIHSGSMGSGDIGPLPVKMYSTHRLRRSPRAIAFSSVGKDSPVSHFLALDCATPTRSAIACCVVFKPASAAARARRFHSSVGGISALFLRLFGMCSLCRTT